MTEAQRDDLRSYFEDFDGEYYRLAISVAKNENGTMFYNIGKIKKENAAQELPRGVTVSGSLADATSAASTNNIRQEGQKSQEVFQKIARCLKTASLRISIGHAKKQPLGCFLVTSLRSFAFLRCKNIGVALGGAMLLAIRQIAKCF